jgi:hypothetical protein
MNAASSGPTSPFDDDDIKALKNCKPGDCLIQMPTSSIEALQSAIDWSAPDAGEQLNRHLQKTALERLLEYQQQGNQTLGFYNDKHDPTQVPQQFAYMLSYSKALPENLPDFYQYLLDYPNSKPSNVDDAFYWARVKFGLKPTLRIVQMITMRGRPGDPVAYAIAQKQLYASTISRLLSISLFVSVEVMTRSGRASISSWPWAPSRRD